MGWMLKRHWKSFSVSFLRENIIFLKVNHFINVINHLFSYLDHELIS